MLIQMEKFVQAGRSGRFTEAAASVSALVRSQAPASEAQAHVTDEVAGALRETGLFWMVVPEEVGGGGGDLHDAIDVVEALSADDGGTGWSFMANALTTGFAAAFVGDDAAEAMFGGNRLALTAGMLAPAGKGVLVDGGIRGGGRYQFGSGCAQADWMGAGMILMKDGKPIMGEDGRPRTRICYVPRERVEFLGNWNVSGLNATGSQDYVLPEGFVAEDYTIDGALVTPLAPRRGGDLYRTGLITWVALGHAAFALGIMRRALEEIATIASSKTRLGYVGTVATNELFQRDFVAAEASYHSGRLFCHDVFGAVQDSALAGNAPTVEQVARMRVCATWLTQVAMDVVRTCHVWSGSAGIREPSDIGRVTRDMFAGSQHMIVDPASLVQFGAPIVAAWNGGVAEAYR